MNNTPVDPSPVVNLDVPNKDDKKPSALSLFLTKLIPNRLKRTQIIIFGTLTLLVGLTLLIVGLLLYNNYRLEKFASIYDFETCSQAKGSLIQESFPEVCVSYDGRRFARILTEEEQKKLQPDETDNWKEYINDEYGFSLKYPSEWEVTEESDSLLGNKLSNSYYFTPPETNPHTGKSIAVIVIIKSTDASYPNNDPKSYFDTLYNKPVSNLNTPDTEEKLGNLTVNGNLAVKMKSIIPNTEVVHPATNIDVHIFKDPYLYIVEAHQGSGRILDPDLLTTFDQILSTFKFIDESLQTESYIACGCGCCAGYEPNEKCIYKTNGDDLSKIIEEDKKTKGSSQCSLVGCSPGIKYTYCD